MTRPTLIAPSILSADHARLAEEIAAVQKAGADWIHVDVMDGHFVPNLTLGPPIIQSIRPATALPFDVHLMIEAPDRSIEQYVTAGANRVTVHVEATADLPQTLGQIRAAGASPGVSLNPATPLDEVLPVLELVDLVLVMTVNPGFGGQSFIRETLPKISALRALLELRGIDAEIEVDGGIDSETIAEVSKAGANVFVAGSAIFGSRDYAAKIRSMRGAVCDYEPTS